MVHADPDEDVKALEATAYRILTDRPEADGTLRWDSTTMVLVEAVAESGQRGLGFSYCAAAAAGVVCDLLGPVVIGCRVDDIAAAWKRMVDSVRNVGRQGIAATAISAVDIALWSPPTGAHSLRRTSHGCVPSDA